MLNRSSTIVLHPTSLPGPYGIGDLGPAARRWVDWLASTGTPFWQVLPLGPTGYGDSPYQCFSAFAGNPYLISPDDLVDMGLLPEVDPPGLPDDHVDYGAVIPWKVALLDEAYDSFARDPGELGVEYVAWRNDNAAWLQDYSLFMAIKEENDLRPWTEWPAPIRMRDPDTIADASARLAETVDRHAFRQFLFFRQWSELRAYARDRGVGIIGDIPIYVAPDCADVWANPELFEIGDDGRPTNVAGVPPDYFSPTGQLWGNPLYRWDAMAERGYKWWTDRLSATFDLVDIVRVDHFRAFADYWRIPAGSKTAVKGKWIDGPGLDFFDTILERFGDLPIIAEDLGELSPKVPALIEATGLPSMKVLQFAFSTDMDDPFIPENYPVNCVVYVGTHDNDTAVGWFQSAPEEEQEFALEYLDSDGTDIAWDFIETAWASRAILAGATLQDVLGLGTEARMNTPSVPAGQWQWRMSFDQLTPQIAERLAAVNEATNRSG